MLRSASYVIFIVEVCVLSCASDIWMYWTQSQQSLCADIGEIPQAEVACADATTRCGLSSTLISPCAMGNGDCMLNGKCTTCADTANQYVPFVQLQPGTPFTGDTCQPTSGAGGPSNYIPFQVQSFVITNPGATQGRGIFPLMLNTEYVNIDGSSARQHNLAKNDFTDGFERSALMYTSQAASGVYAFMSNLYYSVFVIDAPDSSSSTESLIFAGKAARSGPQLEGGVGVPLMQPTTPRTSTSSPAPKFFSVDPLGATSSLFTSNRYTGPPSSLTSSYLTDVYQNGAVNITWSVAEMRRYAFVNQSTPVQYTRMDQQSFDGSIVFPLHPKRIVRKNSTTVPSVVITVSMPASWNRTLQITSDTVSQQLKATLQTTTLFSGSFPRKFSFSIGPSRRASSLLLHKNWNVFACGSQSRDSAFTLSSVAAASDQSVRNIMIPITVFENDQERLQVLGRVGLPYSNYFFEIASPIRVDILPTFAKVILWSDGSWDLFPLNTNDNVPLGMSPAAATTSSQFSYFNDYYNASFTAASAPPTIVSHQKKNGDWVSAVYQSGNSSVMFFGSNVYQQFGSSNQASQFPLSSAPSQPLPDGLVISEVVLGETHTIIRTTLGRIFISGTVMVNQTLDCQDANTGNVTTYAAFTEVLLQNSTLVSNAVAGLDSPTFTVVSVAAGYQYSAFVLVITAGSSVSYSTVIVCGGSYMTGDNTGKPTNMSSLGSPWPSSASNNSQSKWKLFSGRHHFCLSWRVSADGLDSVLCYGNLDITSTGVPTANPANAVSFWKTFAVSNVETFSVGEHHVVLTMLENFASTTYPSPRGLNTIDVRPYAAFRSVMTSGSNRYGQLGAGVVMSAVANNGVTNPRFSFPERVSSTRGPNAYLYFNQENQTDTLSNYQLFETLSARALLNNSYIFQRLKVFNTPSHFMSNFSLVTHNRAPDGKYSLLEIAADIVPEWGPFSRNYFKNPVSSIPNVSQLVWDVRFGLLRGLALFLVQNQTASNGGWKMPADGTYSGSPDCTLQAAQYFTDFEDPSSGTFYRDWRILRRNITVWKDKVISSSGTVRVLESLYTISIPSIFFVSSQGNVYPLASLSRQCGQTGSWCDPVTKTIICNWNAANPPSGYQKLGSSISWMAMFVSIEVVNVTVTRVENTVNGSNVTVSGSSNVTSDALQRAVGITKFANKNELYFCEPKTNVYDCSSVVFFQSFFPAQPSPSSFFSFSRLGMQHRELPLGGSVGMLSLSLNTTIARIVDQCVFLKLGRYYYFLTLQSSGTLKLCEGLSEGTRSVSMSISISRPVPGTTAPSPPAPTTATSPPSPRSNNTIPSIAFRRWSLLSNGLLQIQTVDRKNNLVDFQYYSNSTPFINPDPYNLTLSVGAHGAVAVGWDGSILPSSYMLFSNESVHALLNDQQQLTPTVGPMATSDRFVIRPTGSYGIFQMPVVPQVTLYNKFILWVQPTAPMNVEDRLVIRLITRNRSNPGIQFAIGSNGTTVEFIDEGQRVRSVTKNFYRSVCSVVSTSALVLQSVTNDPSRMFCTPWPVSASTWTRVMLHIESISGVRVVLVYLNSELVAGGSHTNAVDLFTRTVSDVQLTLRNPSSVILYNVLLRELAFCYDPSLDGVNFGSNPFPCAINSKPLSPIHVSQSHTQSQTTTNSDATMTSDRSPSESSTVTQSTSISLTGTGSPSATTEVTRSKTLGSSSFTETSESASNSQVYSTTHSKSHTVFKNLSAFTLQVNSGALSAYFIRKTGVPIVFGIHEDEFNPLADWVNFPNAYMTCTSDLPYALNPSGFCASFGKKGFASGMVVPSNRSLLELVFGPALWYNSYQDEHISLTFLSSAAASQFRVPGIVNFTVTGYGYRMTSSLRISEAASALLTVAGVIAGGPAGGVARVATNSIFLNFHCFNDESYPLSWLMSPTTVEVQGNSRLGVAVVNLSLFAGIGILHLGVAFIVYRKKQDSFKKAQADVHFPGVTISIVTLLIPGYISGAWQGAIQSDTSGFVVLVTVTTVALTLPTLIYLIHTLYDAANFCAVYVLRSAETTKSFELAFPVLSRVVPAGNWKSTDRHNSFVRRFHALIWELREHMQHWYCVEFGEAICVSAISAMSNSNPAVCAAQLALFITIKAVIIAAVLYFRPYSAVLVQFPVVVMALVQAVALTFYLIDTVKGGTKAYQSAYTVMIFTIGMLIVLHSTLVTLCVFSFRYHTWKQQRVMMQVAQHSHGSNAGLSALDFDFATAEANYLVDGTIVKPQDVPVRVMLQEVNDMPTSRSTSVGENDPQSTQSTNDWDDAARNFWRIAAMESLTGEPLTAIPEDDSDLL